MSSDLSTTEHIHPGTAPGEVCEHVDTQPLAWHEHLLACSTRFRHHNRHTSHFVYRQNNLLISYCYTLLKGILMYNFFCSLT